jgi:integrase
MLLSMTKTELLELLKASRSKRRFREQTGTVVERSDGFYIRYYKDGDGGVRTKVTERLCDLSIVDPQKRKLLAKSHLSAINNTHHAALRSETPAPVLTVGAFWDTVYLPWVKSNKRFSTLRGYEYVWELYVKDELAALPLDTYHTIDASAFLDRLAKKGGGALGNGLNKNTLASVRSLMSGIFKRAINTKGPNGKGLIDRNPMRDAETSVKVRKAKPRVKYTLEEIVAILNALDKPDAKLFFALCAVLAMRPEEAAAMKWENIDLAGGVLKVREAAPYGQLGELKTDQSTRDLYFGEDVRGFIEAWHKVQGNPTAGFLFTANGKDPINHNNFAKYHIKPYAMKVCNRWNGCYSGRHGAATRLYDQDGDVRAAYQVLGNSLEMVMKTYIEPDKKTGKMGLDKMQASLGQQLKTTKEQMPAITYIKTVDKP